MRVCPSVEALRVFWQSQVRNPQMSNADIASRVDLRERCIPISLHGDGVPVAGLGKAWARITDVWSWCSCIGQGSTLEMTFYIYAVFHKMLSTTLNARTYRRFAEKLRWSLYWLWLGRWPTHDANGEPYLRVRFFNTKSLAHAATLHFISK